VSHFKEREEKICLNCSAELHGKYCHKCGQENREPKSSAWGLITHFFYDITHFDGKFFSTTGQLIARPGLLPKEYIAGRRARFLDPIRMYVFSSAIFFLAFFTVYKVNPTFADPKSKKEHIEATMARTQSELLKHTTTREDSLLIAQGLLRLEKVLGVIDSTELKRQDSINARNSSAIKQPRVSGRNWKFAIAKTDYKTKGEYDSAQLKLPASKRDNWFERKVMYRNIDLNQRFIKDAKQAWKDILTGFLHTFPYLLFVSLPLYALYLKLLYVRRKKYYYVDHGIFLIFLYIFTFIFLLVFMLLNEVETPGKWDWLDFVILAMVGWGVYYAWRAMHKFYQQGKFKTTIKFLLFNLMCLVSMLLLFGLFFLLTVFSV
jgi:hypothetical protein